MRNPCLSCEWVDADKNRRECVECDRRIAYASGFGAASCSVPEVRSVPHQAASGVDPAMRPGKNIKPEKKKGAQVSEKSKSAGKTGSEAGAEKGRLCAECGPEKGPKPVSAFSRHARSAGGLSKLCKECMGARIKGGLSAKQSPPKPWAKGGPIGEPKEDSRNPPTVDTGESWDAAVILKRLFTDGIKKREKDLEDYVTAEKMSAQVGHVSEFIPRLEETIKDAWGLSLDFYDYPDLLEAIDKRARENFRSPDMEALKILSDALGVKP